MPDLRLAFDQNFPLDLLDAITPWLPTNIETQSIFTLDPALSTASDRELFILLADLGWNGLISNNYKMINKPDEVAAMVHTKAVVVFTKEMGNDPVRAAGALLLELPGLEKRIKQNIANVFMLKFEHRQPVNAWEYLKDIATRTGVEAGELWEEYRPSANEVAEILAQHGHH